MRLEHKQLTEQADKNDRKLNVISSGHMADHGTCMVALPEYEAIHREGHQTHHGISYSIAVDPSPLFQRVGKGLGSDKFKKPP